MALDEVIRFDSELVQVNRLSDMALTLTLQRVGEAVAFPAYDFKLTFFVPGHSNTYECRRVGGISSGLVRNADGTVTCFLHSPRFACGRLWVRFAEYIPDEDFADDEFAVYAPQPLPIEIVPGKGSDLHISASVIAPAALLQVDDQLNTNSANPIANKPVATAVEELNSALDSKAPASHTHTASDITDLEEYIKKVVSEIISTEENTEVDIDGVTVDTQQYNFVGTCKNSAAFNFYIGGTTYAATILGQGDDGNYVWAAQLGEDDISNKTSSNIFVSSSSYGTKNTNIVSVQLMPEVLSIDSYAFSFCTSLTQVVLPDGLTSLGSSAFYGCSALTDVTFPEGLASLDNEAFSNCTSLSGVTLPAGLLSLGSSAFAWCTSLASVTLPDGLTTIDYGAFKGCSALREITIPDSVVKIGSSAFRDCKNLTEITIPEGVTTIDTYAFDGCKSLASVTLPDSLTTIAYFAFNDCSALTAITLPDGVTTLGMYAFYGCSSLSEITLPESLSSIDSYAFGHTALPEITLPAGLTVIGNFAFMSISKLKNVTCLATSPPTLGDPVFEGLTNIFVPSASLSKYKSASRWASYSNIISAIA